MAWKRKGMVIPPSGPEGFTHVANPCICEIENGLLRVFYASRDNDGRAHIFCADLDPNNEFKVVKQNEVPVLLPGKEGSFDENGVVPGNVIFWEKDLFMFYMGWNVLPSGRWANSIGVAKWDDQKMSFKRVSEGPVIARDTIDHFTVSYPFVVHYNESFKMWYGSHECWDSGDGNMIHKMNMASSDDILKWNKSAQDVFPLKEDEYAVSRPWVMGDGDGFKMWCSIKKSVSQESYFIGCAESSDGVVWERTTDDEMHTGDEEWEVEMVAYPCVFRWNHKTYMLYNGNGYGKSGIGLAEHIK